MLIIPVNLSSEEAFHQFGKLTDERMESLFDAETAIDKLSGGECLIQEALAQFPDEDFLHDAMGHAAEELNKLTTLLGSS